MGAELTVRQKILVAATALSDESEAFSVEDLIVRSWMLYPESFSLRGYHAKHPDSNRVLAKLSGADGLCGLGWLEHTDQRTYRVTRKGRTVAKQLVALASGTGAAVLAANESGETEQEAPTTTKVAPRREEIAKPVKPAARKAESKAAKADLPSKVVVTLTPHEVIALGSIAKAEALRKFLRGSPLTFVDACGFWSISAARPAGVMQKIEGVEDLLRRAVESFGPEGAADPRLPPLSTCYGLLNLHKLMLGRFSRELDAIKVQAAAG